jgi:Raf kinase inhibitor-like YbhB/YbcL family protein
MSRLTHHSTGLLVVAIASFALAQSSASEAKIAVSSPAFPSGGNIPERFSCKGANVNPPLQFSGIPTGTKSLVLIMDDPDAPGGLFTHWLVWNIDPATTHIGEKSVPAGGVQGSNDFGNAGYGGPCPPSGTHRYFFRLFALDQKLDLKSGAKRSALEHALAGHILARGELMGRFSH